jgi:cell division protein FtsQ
MRTATTTAETLPGDIRLMQMTAALFAVLGVLLLCAVLVLWAARQPLFALRSIRIEGDVTRNSLQTIRANAMPRLAGSYFNLRLDAARAAFESVPWVRQAVVRRVFPDRMVVRLEEHRAAALWAADGATDRLVNSFGEVFQANPGDVEDDALPTFTGPAGTAPRMLALHRRLAEQLTPLEVRIETLALSGRGSWRAELDSGAQLELGRGEDDELVERTRRFAATLPQVARRYGSTLQYADLRHRDGYALRLKGITTTAPNDKVQRN